MIRLFLLATLFAVVANTRAAEPEHMQLFLLIGQSNMAGRGAVGPEDQQTNPRIWMMDKEKQWVPAKDPVHFDKPIAGVGLASEFAREIIKTDPKITVGLIPCAVGGTSLDQWKIGGPLYTAAIERAKAAQKSGTLAGILWHQGEADSSPDKVATYAERFATMIAQLRKDLGAEKVPVIVGELGRFREASTGFNAALPEVPKRVPLCALVTAEDLADKGDKLHFDAPSLKTFGRRYAAAYFKLGGHQ